MTEKERIELVLKLLAIPKMLKNREIQKWLEEPENEKLYEECRFYLETGLRKKEHIRVNVDEKYRKFICKIEKHRSLVWRKWSVAAACFLLGMVGMIFWFTGEKTEDRVIISENRSQAGNSQAVLEITQGEQVVLNSRQGERVSLDEGVVVSNDSSGGLDYSVQSEQKLAYHKLQVPRKGEYKLVLHDGTKVWLNSESELEYPTVFQGNERRVKLKGEGYFEVEKDSLHPFIVEIQAGFEVKVLGTSFNVKAYETDERFETTLVEGRVVVKQDQDLEVEIKPFEQVVIKKEGGHEVRAVNPDYYIAWHEGWFYFDNEPLKQVLLMVGRWYDIDFEFAEDVLKDIRVTGKVRRFEDLNTILGMLTETINIQFEEDGYRVKVEKDKK